MKKTLFAALLILISVPCLFASEPEESPVEPIAESVIDSAQNFPADVSADSTPDFYFSVSVPYASMRYGVLNEFVLCRNVLNEQVKLSELNWQQHWQVSAGLNACIGWKSLRLDSFTNIAGPGMKTGLMLDSDWQNVIENASNYHTVLTSNTLNPEINGIKTNYSETICRLEYFLDEFVNLSWTVAERDGLYFSFLGAYEYSLCKYYSLGGEATAGKFNSAAGYYESYDSETATIYVWSEEKKTGAYTRIDMNAWSGIGFCYRQDPRFCVNLQLYVSPFSYVVSRDDHFTTGNSYIDTMMGLFSAARASFEMDWAYSRYMTAWLRLDAAESEIIQGVTKDPKTLEIKDSYTPGCSFSRLDLSLGVKFGL